MAADDSEEPNEETWTRETLMPLLRRLGFWKVDLTHGPLETGRDLVLGDVDRFGVPTYACAQVKLDLNASGGGKDFEEVIAQVKSAYQYKHRDSTSGLEYRMSGVYLIVRGRITEAARIRLYERAGERAEGWLRTIDADQLAIAEHASWARAAGADIPIRVGLAMAELGVVERLLGEIEGKLGSLTEGGDRIVGDFALSPTPVSSWALERALEELVSLLDPMDVAALFHFRLQVVAVSQLRAMLFGKHEYFSVLPSLISLRDQARSAAEGLPLVRRILDAANTSPFPEPGKRYPRVRPPKDIADPPVEGPSTT